MYGGHSQSTLLLFSPLLKARQAPSLLPLCSAPEGLEEEGTAWHLVVRVPPGKEEHLPPSDPQAGQQSSLQGALRVVGTLGNGEGSPHLELMTPMASGASTQSPDRRERLLLPFPTLSKYGSPGVRELGDSVGGELGQMECCFLGQKWETGRGQSFGEMGCLEGHLSGSLLLC